MKMNMNLMKIHFKNNNKIKHNLANIVNLKWTKIHQNQCKLFKVKIVKNLQ